MTRLKAGMHKICKLNYEALKLVLEAQEPDAIPFEAEIQNRHQLVAELDAMEREARLSREAEKIDRL